MKCKECAVFGCQYRTTDAEKDCYYEEKEKQLIQEQFDWQSFRNQASKDILCAAMSNPYSINDDLIDIVRKSINLADELIKQLKEREEK